MANEAPFSPPPAQQLYGRYQSNQVDQYPAGYLESFNQQAQLRARAAEFAVTAQLNAENSARAAALQQQQFNAQMQQRSQEFATTTAISQQNQLKAQQLAERQQAATERQNQLAYAEKMASNNLEQRKYEIEQQKANILLQTETRKAALEDLKFKNDWTKTQSEGLTSTVSALDRRMANLRARLSEDNLQPDEIFSINSELASLTVQSGNAVKSLARLTGVTEVPASASPSLSRYYAPTSPAEPSTPAPTPGASFQGASNIPAPPPAASVSGPVAQGEMPNTAGNVVPLSSQQGTTQNVSNISPFAANTGEPASYTGPLNKKYVDWKPTQGIANTEIRQTIYPLETKNEDGSIKTSYQVAYPISNVGQSDAENDIFEKQKRAMSQMAFFLDNKLVGNVTVTGQEIQNAAKNFGVKGLNDTNIVQIAKAFKLHSMLIGEHPNGEYTPEEVAANALFENKYGLTANEHFLLGDEGKTVYSTSSAENEQIARDAKQSRTEQIRLSKEEPEVVDTGYLKSIDEQQKVIETETKNLNKIDSQLKYNPPKDIVASLTQQRLNAAERINAAQANVSAISSKINHAKSKNEARTNQMNSLAKIAEIPGDMAKTELVKGELAVKATGAADRLAGWNMSSLINNGGYRVKALALLENRSYEAVVYDKKGNVVKAEIPLSRFIQRAIDNGDYKGIAKLLLETPDDKAIAYHLESNEKLSASIVPMTKLFEGAVKMDSYGFGTQLWEKIFDSEANTLEPFRKALIAGMRTDIVGPGNPSNFEQEMMQDIIPDVKSIFSVSERNVRRIQEVALLKIIAHFNSQDRAGYEPTQMAVDRYNEAFGKIIGRNLTLNELRGLVKSINTLESTRIKDNNSANYTDSRNSVFGSIRGLMQDFIINKAKQAI